MIKNNNFTALEGFLFITLSISSLSTIFNTDMPLGLVWATLFGLMFGSFATSFVARIPLGIMQKKADPYCMSCKHPLERRDLYTIFSYLATKGKCRFCDARIPEIIFYTEVLVTIAYIVAYLQYGFSANYVLAAFCYFGIIIAASLWINNKFISYPLLGGVLILLCAKIYHYSL